MAARPYDERECTYRDVPALGGAVFEMQRICAG